MFKRVSPVIVVGILLTIVCVGLYVNRNEFIQQIQNNLYDHILQKIHKPIQSQEVVIVDIDDYSLANIGQWPWSRFIVAQLTQNILDAGASVIGFDIVFAEKDRTSPAMITGSLKQYFDLDVSFQGLPDNFRDYDLIFAEALARGNTILGCVMIPVDEVTTDVDHSKDPYYANVFQTKDPDKLASLLLQSCDLMIAIPELLKASKTAYFNAYVDPDSVVRSNPLIWAYGNRIYPSLALRAVMLHREVQRCNIEYDEHGLTQMSLRGIKIPVDRYGRIILNYRELDESRETGFYSSFPTYSALDVLSGETGKNELKNKIVFIGSSAVGLRDLRATPITQFFSGVEIHATMVDNILAGDVLRSPNWMPGVYTLSIFAIGIFLTILISRGRSWLSFIIAVGMMLLFYQLSIYFLKVHNFAFVPAWVILSIVIMYPTLTMIKFWQEELQKKKVRNMFGTMVSKQVLSYLEKNPESFSLVGRRAEATMFFSDVAGFTTISESLQPEKLSDLLNRYLSPMTKIIMARNGYVDKYEGDAIMAEWGVPYHTEDHAQQACYAALEQQKALAELRPRLRDEFGYELYVRMGINSGPVTAGNMGSEGRFQYTVMGDAVNLAARLEPANKDYGTEIMIGDNTFQLVKDYFVTMMIDIIVVKGKTKPVSIYELVDVKGQVDEKKWKIIDLYEKALRLHWERKWDESIMLLNELSALAPDHKAGINLINRIAYYKNNPPGEGWSGEHVRASKD